MNYSSIITIKKDIDNIYDCLIQEKNTKTDRSSIKIIKHKNELSIEISAKDLTALRATQNSILKLLVVYEKIRGIK